MQVFKVFLLLLISIFGSMAYEHGHGTSHMSVHHKHGGKFEYHIKHGKHGSHHGSSHPHGYGGYGDSH